jgi:hypothetical protein
MNNLRKEDWRVERLYDKRRFGEARELVRTFHYARGCSNTFTDLHVLLHKSSEKIMGCCFWLPPTRVAAESVNIHQWKRVVSLSRLVVHPSVPRNAATFMLSRAVKSIDREGRFCTLVTYADTEQGHTGTIYRAQGWEYIGLGSKTPVYVDDSGKRVAKKSTVNRTEKQLFDLGVKKIGNFAKHKFVKHLTSSVFSSHGVYDITEDIL